MSSDRVSTFVKLFQIFRSRRWLSLGVLVVLLSSGLLACGNTFWESKDYNQRLTYMGVTVFPAMKALFEELDATRYGENKFQCETCHGQQGPANGYKMPSSIFPIDPNNPTSRNDSDPQLAKYAAFMEDKVMPKMKELMQRDDITCNYCHAVKQ